MTLSFLRPVGHGGAEGNFAEREYGQEHTGRDLSSSSVRFGPALHLLHLLGDREAKWDTLSYFDTVI